jgi:parvulin-like peptidyl-prolyl isomerase
MDKKYFWSFILAVFMVLACGQLRGEVIDKIVVVANIEVITEGEIERIMGPIYQQYRSMYQGQELIEKLSEVRKKVVEQLIEDRLILSEAKKQNIEVTEKELDQRMEEVGKHFKSKAEFEAALAEQKLTMKELRKRNREQMMVRKMIDRQVGSRISISPVEVSEYYTKHADDFMQPEEVRLSNILIRPKDGANWAQAQKQAKEILERIRSGGDFAALAKEYSSGPNASEGGSMGYVKKGDLLPAIENIVFNLREGDVSDVIQTGLGYHIFKVEEKRTRRAKELSEVRREVEEAIFKEKIKDKIRAWVDNLKKNAYIEFK